MIKDFLRKKGKGILSRVWIKANSLHAKNKMAVSAILNGQFQL